jgi:hypothetical protein
MQQRRNRPLSHIPRSNIPDIGLFHVISKASLGSD